MKLQSQSIHKKVCKPKHQPTYLPTMYSIYLGRCNNSRVVMTYTLLYVSRECHFVHSWQQSVNDR